MVGRAADYRPPWLLLPGGSGRRRWPGAGQPARAPHPLPGVPPRPSLGHRPAPTAVADPGQGWPGSRRAGTAASRLRRRLGRASRRRASAAPTGECGGGNPDRPARDRSACMQAGSHGRTASAGCGPGRPAGGCGPPGRTAAGAPGGSGRPTAAPRRSGRSGPRRPTARPPRRAAPARPPPARSRRGGSARRSPAAPTQPAPARR